VLARLEFRGAGAARATLLCGGDRGNGIRGDALGPCICNALPSIKLGWTKQRGDAAGQEVKLARDREGQEEGEDEVVEGQPVEWPAVNRRGPDTPPPSYSEHRPWRTPVPISPDIEKKTRVEDTDDMGRVLVAAEHIKVGELVVQEAPLLVWPTGVSSKVEYYQGVVKAYLSAHIAARKEVDNLCHPCTLDKRGTIGRQYRAMALVLFHLRDIHGLKESGGAGEELLLTRVEEGEEETRLAICKELTAQQGGSEEMTAHELERTLTVAGLWRLIASIDCNSIGYGHETCAVFARGSKAAHDCFPNTEFSINSRGEAEYRAVRDISPGEQVEHIFFPINIRCEAEYRAVCDISPAEQVSITYLGNVYWLSICPILFFTGDDHVPKGRVLAVDTPAAIQIDEGLAVSVPMPSLLAP
jgi:hypothetical protein